ncbi:MAG TPA: DUF6498-containing protein [Thermoanaerobaculia bacterium]|nr:DUF6498-containing protein [Thermoanaerobaculia bacterium]
MLRALLSLAKNSVPALGVLARGWAAPDAMLLYLGENLVLIALAALLIRILAPNARKSIGTFLLVAVPFTFGAAVFTIFVLIVRVDVAFNPRELLLGFALMLVFQLFAFVRDLRRLRGISVPDSENLLVGVLGRVFLLAFAVWAGILLALFVARAFILPFIVLKSIVDLWSLRELATKQRAMMSV